MLTETTLNSQQKPVNGFAFGLGEHGLLTDAKDCERLRQGRGMVRV